MKVWSLAVPGPSAAFHTVAVDAVRPGVQLLDRLALAGGEEHLVLLGHPALVLDGMSTPFTASVPS